MDIWKSSLLEELLAGGHAFDILLAKAVFRDFQKIYCTYMYIYFQRVYKSLFFIIVCNGIRWLNICRAFFFFQRNSIQFSLATAGKGAFLRVFTITTAMKKVSIQLNVLDGPISY